MITNFAHWYPLAKAAEHTPAVPGVYQVKTGAGLVEYPSGKSAMVFYGCAHNMLVAARELASIYAGGGEFMCRHQSSDSPAVLLDFVLGQFVRRFGAKPTWPAGASS